MRILLVEDDNMIGHSLRQALTETGLSVDWVRDGVLAESALAQGSYAAVLLDLGLPRRSGLEVLRRARQEGNRTPMLVLTARDGLDDRVSGLDLGADDYLVKPFELRELLARMRAIIRRAGGHAQSTIGTSQTQLDLATRQLVHEGATVDLSAREFHLMHALLERPGAIVSRTQLEERIYGWGEEVTSNAVEVLIHGVRRKAGAEVIRNVRGLGWRVAGRPVVTSLRRHLLLWLVPVFLAAALIAVGCTYYMFGAMVSWFMDSQMQVLAESHTAETIGPPALRPLTDHHIEKGGVIVQIWDGQGSLLTSTYPALAVPLQAADGFEEVKVGSQRWRVYSVHTPARTVQAIQDAEFRVHVIKKQALQAGLPIALLIPISAVILWLAIRVALRRLETVARAAAAQDENTIAELPPRTCRARSVRWSWPSTDC